jgi:Tol biopolymer transport system component
MTYTCLRCDWQGVPEEPACPSCGERPLYVVGASPSGTTENPARDDPDIRGSEPAITRNALLSGDPYAGSRLSPSPEEAVEPSGGSARSAAVFVLAALVLTITLGTWLKAHEERPVSAAPTDATVPDAPANDGSTGPTLEGVTPSDPPRFRRHTVTEHGIPFSFRVPTGVGWERFSTLSTARIPAGPISLNRSITGPQGAEIIIYWSSFPDGDHADPCTRLLSELVGPTAEDLAAAVATAPGTKLVSGPSDVTIGGRPAKHVVLTVREHVGCDPGFFFGWRDRNGGALWTRTSAGATIRVWILDVAGTRLFFAAATTREAAGRSDLDEQIRRIVGSIRFERPGPSVRGSSVADYVIDLRTGDPTQLPEAILRSLDEASGGRWEGSRYAASPHGGRLAFVGASDDGTHQVFIARLDGTRVHQVTRDPGGAASPAWSPDGTEISYSAYGGGEVRNLFVHDLTTGEFGQVTNEAYDVWDSQFTPDGSSLLYTGGSDEVPLLMTVPVTGGPSRLLLWPVSGLPDSGNGSLSPDGSLVTFMGSGTPSSGDPSHCGPCRWVANADGTERRVILGCYGSNPAGTWSPDGSRIVCSNGGRIVVVDIATGDASRVAEGSGAIWIDGHTLLVEGPAPQTSTVGETVERPPMDRLTRTAAGVRFSLGTPSDDWVPGPIKQTEDGGFRNGHRRSAREAPHHRSRNHRTSRCRSEGGSGRSSDRSVSVSRAAHPERVFRMMGKDPPAPYDRADARAFPCQRRRGESGAGGPRHAWNDRTSCVILADPLSAATRGGI